MLDPVSTYLSLRIEASKEWQSTYRVSAPVLARCCAVYKHSNCLVIVDQFNIHTSAICTKYPRTDMKTSIAPGVTKIAPG